MSDSSSSNNNSNHLTAINNDSNNNSSTNFIDLSNDSSINPIDVSNNSNNILRIPLSKEIKKFLVRQANIFDSMQVDFDASTTIPDPNLLERINRLEHNQLTVQAAVAAVVHPENIALREFRREQQEARKKQKSASNITIFSDESNNNSNSNSVYSEFTNSISSNSIVRKKQKIPLKLKIEILDYIKLHKDYTLEKVAGHFGKVVTTISSIKQKEAEHRLAYSQCEFNEKIKNRSRSRKGQYDILENCLALWITFMRNKKNPNVAGKVQISLDMALAKAKSLRDEVIKQLKLSKQYLENPSKFTNLITEYERAKFSSGWYDKVLQRQDLKDHKLHGEAGSVDLTTVTDYRKSLADLLKTFSLSDIYNVDEFALFYRLLPARTYDLACKSKNIRGDKKDKTRVTGVICCNADGSHKFRPMVIGKYANPRPLKGINRTTLPCFYTHQQKGWMEFSIFRKYIDSLNEKIRKDNPSRKIVLLIDGAGSHKGIEQLTFSNILVKLFPANTTSMLQPLDAGIIRSLKARYRARLAKEMLAEIEINDKPLVITLKLAIDWVAYAWSEVQAKSIRNCWKHTGILGEAHEATIKRLNKGPEESELSDLILESKYPEAPTDMQVLAECLTKLYAEPKAKEILDLNCNVTEYLDADKEIPTCEEEAGENEPTNSQMVRRELIVIEQVSFDTEEKEYIEISEDDEPEADTKLYTMNEFMQAMNVAKTFLHQRQYGNQTDHIVKIDSVISNVRNAHIENLQQSTMFDYYTI